MDNKPLTLLSATLTVDLTVNIGQIDGLYIVNGNAFDNYQSAVEAYFLITRPRLGSPNELFFFEGGK